MNEPLDEVYLRWLYEQIANPKLRQPGRTFWNLARQLFKKEFIWFVANDDNRVEDGRNLRYEFITEAGIADVEPDWVNLGCSMLEMMVGLSRRLAFEADGSARVWFSILLRNVDLMQYNDARYDDRVTEIVDDILNRIIWRRYSYDGSGGLFPLKNAEQDQRKTELWYQLSAYILENE